MTVEYMEGKHGQGYRCATHITKVFVKRTILFLQCSYLYFRLLYFIHGLLGVMLLVYRAKFLGHTALNDESINCNIPTLLMRFSCI